MRKNPLFLFFPFFAFFGFLHSPVSAGLKTFVLEHEYRMGESESEQDARIAAISQAKKLLLEEVGIYVSTKTTIRQTLSGTFTQQEVVSISAGITKTRILQEQLRRPNYFVKLRVEVDAEDAEKKLREIVQNDKLQAQLNQITKERNQALADNKRLNIELDQKKRELEDLEKQLAINRSEEILVRTEEAKKVFQGTLRKKKRTIQMLSLLELDQQALQAEIRGDFRQAVGFYRRSLDIRLESEPADSLFLAAGYDRLGTAEWRNGNYDNALRYHKEALSIRDRKLPDDDLSIARSYNQLGLIYQKKGDTATAIFAFEKALNINLKKLGPEHNTVAANYNNLGLVHKQKKNYERAIFYYEKSLDMGLKKLGPRHPFMATRYGNLGGVYHAKGEHDRAIEYFEKALDIDLGTLGLRHPQIAIHFNNLGTAYDGKGHHNRAIDFYRRALDIELKKLGSRHPNVATRYHNLGAAFLRKGDFKRAKIFFDKSFDIRREKLGVKHPYTKSTFELLALLKIKEMERNKSEENPP